MSVFNEIKKAGKKKGEGELWLMSYADLVTNLMAFFIMLLAISKVDFTRFESIASKTNSKQGSDNLESLKKRIDERVKEQKIEHVVKTNLDMTGLTVEFTNGVMFESASAQLSKFAVNEALSVLKILQESNDRYNLSFEGHTDDVPIKTNVFSNNWQLSSARGVSLLNKMQELGVEPHRMSVKGYADTQPTVPTTNKTGQELEKARAQNRRVTIRVHQ